MIHSYFVGSEAGPKRKTLTMKSIALAILALVTMSACATGNVNLRDDQIVSKPQLVRYQTPDQIVDTCQDPFAVACEIGGWVYISTDASPEMRVWMLVHEGMHQEGLEHGKRTNTYQYKAFNREVLRRYKKVTDGALTPIEFAPRRRDAFSSGGFSN